MPPWRIDAVLATCFVLTGLTSTNQSSAVYELRDGVAIGLILATTLPSHARRLAPLPVYAGVGLSVPSSSELLSEKALGAALAGGPNAS